MSVEGDVGDAAGPLMRIKLKGDEIVLFIVLSIWLVWGLVTAGAGRAPT